MKSTKTSAAKRMAMQVAKKKGLIFADLATLTRKDLTRIRKDDIARYLFYINSS